MSEELFEKKRKHLDQALEQEENKKILPRDARSTSSWNRRITKLMNIKVEDREIFVLENNNSDEGNPLYFSMITDDMWEGRLDIENLPVDRKFLNLLDEAKDINNFKNKLSEYHVDAYMNTFLQVLDMNLYPLSVRPQCELTVKIGLNSEKITSIPDLLIKTKKSTMLVIVEDKNLDNATYVNNWKEDQVLGELFVAAHNMKVRSKFEFYGIRVIGTLFTFYKANVIPEYIKESISRIPKEHCMNVYRYPNPGDNVDGPDALDFCKLEDRKVIVQYLEKIKETLL